MTLNIISSSGFFKPTLNIFGHSPKSIPIFESSEEFKNSFIPICTLESNPFNTIFLF